MNVCGLKLTHDGAVALLRGEQLVFSVEMEKLGNRRRYSTISDLSILPAVLAGFGYQLSDVDKWVVDGWDGIEPGFVDLFDHGVSVKLTVGPYCESARFPDLAMASVTGEFSIGGRSYPYSSYTHAAGHVASAYYSSPFALRREPSFVLIWDGGMFPRLYWIDPACGIENGGELFRLIGHVYATAAHHFGPFRRDRQSSTVDDLAVAGKLMAYIALGEARSVIIDILCELFYEFFEGDSAQAARYRDTVGGFGSLFEPSMPPLHAFFGSVRERAKLTGVSDEDVLASVHRFLEELLVARLTGKVKGWKGDGPWNLCLAGGCALNIKWNSALRSLPLFGDVWVPPFPNDSGSAIGAAALGAVQHAGLRSISWHTRLGPPLPVVEHIPAGWSRSTCSPQRLARVLHETGEPIVLLNGRAELGPRALGGRSILASATTPGMKDKLNQIKGREPYRPVAPVCLVDAAPEIFDPGTPDPYMLFEHKVRSSWVSRIPAVVHLDGTARLQTVCVEDDPFLSEVLHEYRSLSGVPVLCNTSANFNGCGFFPDVESAAAWGQVERIWSAGILYEHLGD